MDTDAAWYVKTSDGQLYGPVDEASLLAWAREGRIEPTSMLSPDREQWVPISCKRELEMDWIVEQGQSGCFGPFHRDVIRALITNGQIQPTDRIYKRMSFEAPGELAVAQEESRRLASELETVKAEKLKVEEKLKATEDALKATENSLKAAEDSLKVTEDSLKAMEERAQEAERKNLKPAKGGLFFGRSLRDLAMMEESARRELAAARQFGRRVPAAPGGEVIDVGGR